MIRLRPLVRLAAVALLLGTALAAGSAQAKQKSARKLRKERAAARHALQLQTFDHAWQRIDETYPYADFRGLDWNAVRAELRPKAQRCDTAAQLRPILRAMLARLGESHFQVLPGLEPDLAEPAMPPEEEAGPAPDGHGDLGMDVRAIGREFVVVRVDPGSPAEQAGIATGWTVVAVGDTHSSDVMRRAAEARDQHLASYLGWATMTAAMRGAPGSEVVVQVKGADPQLRTLALTRRDPPGETVKLGNLPDLVAEFEKRTLPGDVGYIRFSMFMTTVAVPFTDAMRGFVKDRAKGVIIDLRGNPGGVGGLVMGMAGHFVHEQGKSLGMMKTREAELNFVANPRGPGAEFTGPVAILVDSLSLSTSEIFAAGMQQLGRARVFGTRTGGMALPSVIESLPNGDRLQFAIADLTAPGGRRIEGVGVAPDVEVELRKDDLLAGHDAVLDAARAWVLQQAETGTSK